MVGAYSILKLSTSDKYEIILFSFYFSPPHVRQKISRKLWRVSLINANYQMCDTYPPLLAVPAKITGVGCKLALSIFKLYPQMTNSGLCSNSAAKDESL